MIEYDTQAEAKAAIEQATGAELLGLELQVDWAFVRGRKSAAQRLVSFESPLIMPQLILCSALE